MAGGKETGFKDFNIVKPNSPATQNSPHAEIEQPTAGSSNVQQSPTESNVSSPEHRLVIAENIEQSLVPTKTPKSNVKWNIEKLVQNDDDMSLEKNKILMNLHNDERKPPQGILKSTPSIKEQHNRPYLYGSQKGQQISEPEKRVNLMFKQPAQQRDLNKSVQEQRNLQNIHQSPSSPLATPQNVHQMQPQSQYLYSANQPSQTHGQQPAYHENNYPNLQVNQQQYTPNNAYQQPKYPQNIQNQQLQNPPSIANQQRQCPPNSTNQPIQYQSNLTNHQLQHPTDSAYQQLQFPPNTAYQQQQYSTNMTNHQILYSPNMSNQELQYTPPNTANQQSQFSFNPANQQLPYSSNMARQQLQFSPNTGNKHLQYSSNMDNQQSHVHVYSQKMTNHQLQHTPSKTADQHLQHSPIKADQQTSYSKNTVNQKLKYTQHNTTKQSQDTADQQQLYSSNMTCQQPPYSPEKVNQTHQYSQNISRQPFGSREQYPPNKDNEEHVQVSQLKHESFNKSIADQQDFQQSGQKHESFYTDQPLTQDHHPQQVAKVERAQQEQNRIENHHPNLGNQPTAQHIQNQHTEVQTSSLASQRLQHTPTQNGSIYAHAAISPYTKQARSTGETVIAENQHAGQISTIPNAKETDDNKKEKIQSQKRKALPACKMKDSKQNIELDFIASPPVLFTPEYLMLKIPKQEKSNSKAVSNEKNKKRSQSPVDGSESLESGPVKKLKLEEARICTASIDQYPESEESRRNVQIHKRGFKKYLLSRYEEDKRMLAHSITKIQCEKPGPPPNNDSVLYASSNIPLKRTYASCDLAPKDPAPDGVGNKTNERIALSVGNKENTKISRNDINVVLDKETNTESPKQCNEQSSVQEPILSDLDNTSTFFPTENGSEISLNQIRLDLTMSSDSSVASDTEKSLKNDVSQCSGDQCSEIADCTDSTHLLGHDDSTNARDKNNHTSIKPVTVLSTFFSQSTNQMILPSFDQGRNIGFLIDFNPRRFGIIEHEDHLEQNFNAIPAKPTFSYRMTQNQRWNNLLAVRNTALLYQKFTQTV
ncbi:uncharacterized protein LOC143069645 [Mytilus galloprovincialis]|uniref:uncharacterized protein LOC143069645 n=1 Tax=Mytilus galloprovincialis TaxID=29158 RepID=UPI003F7C812D